MELPRLVFIIEVRWGLTDIGNNLKKLYIIFIILFSLSFGGCESYLSKRGYEKKENITLQIESIKKEYSVQLDKSQKATETKYQEIIDKQEKNGQEANVNIYGIINLSGLKVNKERIDNLIEYKSRAAFSLLPPLTPAQLIAENDNIRKELDATQTSLEDLKKKYAQTEQENIKKHQEVDIAKNELAQIKEENQTIKNDLASKLNELQELRNKISESQLADSAAREQRIKDDKEMRAKIAYGAAGFGAILILLGVLVLKSPVMVSLGGGSIAFSLFVATAPTWVLWTIPLVIFVLAGAYLFYKYHKEKDLNNGNLRSIQRFKEAATEQYETILKPILKDEHGKYDKDGKVVEDAAKVKEIDKRLIDLNIK